MWGESLRSYYEANLLERFVRLENWHDNSVYKDESGNIIPEYLYFMIAIKSYFNLKESEMMKSGGKAHPGDI